MIKVKFIHDGRHKGWRYREGDEVLLPDGLGNLALNEGMAIEIKAKERETAVNRRAHQSLEQARRSLK